MSEKKSKTDIEKELVRQLVALRSNFETITEQYSLNVQALIEEMIRIQVF